MARDGRRQHAAPRLRARRGRRLHARSPIEQTAAEDHPTLRPHRLGIGLYDRPTATVGDVLERVGYDEVDIAGERTELAELVGTSSPTCCCSTTRTSPTPRSASTSGRCARPSTLPRGFQDSLPRSLVLGAAWDMTRDAEMPARDFVRLVLDSLPGETDSTLLRVLARPDADGGAAVHGAGAPRRGTALLSASLRALADAAEPGSDAQFQLVEAWAATRPTRPTRPRLRALLVGRRGLHGLAVDTELRWTFTKALAADRCGRCGRDPGRARP